MKTKTLFPLMLASASALFILPSISRESDGRSSTLVAARKAVNAEVLHRLNPSNSLSGRLTRSVSSQRSVYQVEFADSGSGAGRIGFRIVHNTTRRGPTGARKIVAIGQYEVSSGLVFLYDITKAGQVPASQHPFIAATRRST